MPCHFHWLHVPISYIMLVDRKFYIAPTQFYFEQHSSFACNYFHDIDNSGVLYTEAVFCCWISELFFHLLLLTHNMLFYYEFAIFILCFVRWFFFSFFFVNSNLHSIGCGANSWRLLLCTYIYAVVLIKEYYIRLCVWISSKMLCGIVFRILIFISVRKQNEIYNAWNWIFNFSFVDKRQYIYYFMTNIREFRVNIKWEKKNY